MKRGEEGEGNKGRGGGRKKKKKRKRKKREGGIEGKTAGGRKRARWGEEVRWRRKE